MNILDRINSIFRDSDAPEAEAISESELKRQHAVFHREKVRNGPVKFSSPTNGQLKRARRRELDRQAKRARKAQVQRYFADRQEVSTLRGNLQAVGILPYFQDSYKVHPAHALRSTIWILEKFTQAPKGEQIVVDHKVVVDALTAALNRYQVLTGQPVTPLSPAYQLPVQVAA